MVHAGLIRHPMLWQYFEQPAHKIDASDGETIAMMTLRTNDSLMLTPFPAFSQAGTGIATLII
jgi:hypothetical protein